MNPLEVIESAEAGSTVLYRLRGPATADELDEVREALKAQFPAITFLVEAGADESHAVVLE